MINKDCPLIPKVFIVPGYCSLESCGKPLTGRQHKWCSKKCQDVVFRDPEHDWESAKKLCWRRCAHRCVVCESTGVPPKEDYTRLINESWAEWNKRLDKQAFDNRLEVNHIKPRNGISLHRPSCLNHQDNLELLCRQHHQIETNKQRRDRKNTNV